MTLTQHTILTGIASAALAPFLNATELSLFAVGGILIDIDHYFLYVQRKRSLSISGMFRYFRDFKPVDGTLPYIGLCAFHTFDFFMLLAILAMHHPALWSLVGGCLYHFCIDLASLKRSNALFVRAFFLVEHLIRRRAPGYPQY